MTANLRRSLSDLRQVFGDALTITRQIVALNRDGDYWLDVEAFESALARDEPVSGNLGPLREAVALYRGEFVEGFSVRQAQGFEEWVLQERERLRQLAIEGLHRLAEACTARGEYAAGIEYANRLLALEPWQEEGQAAAERAVELLAFVLHYSASSQEARDRAVPLLAELEGRLSSTALAAAKERGRARDLQDIVEEIVFNRMRPEADSTFGPG